MPVQFTILGSGSSGNCAYFESDDTRLLVDAGFSAKQIRERLSHIGRTPETLTGILITHEHGDHIQGLGILCSKIEIPIFANRFTCEAIQRQFPQTRFLFSQFETGAAFDVGTVAVQSFSVPHDAMDPVGFLLQTPECKLGFLTDLGHATRLLLERVRPAQILVLEANHDVRQLQEDTRRPWSTKQRILSRHGHLSNEAAATVACELASSHLKRIYLGHLSRDCNSPELARSTVEKRLKEIGITHIHLESTFQDRPCPTLHWKQPTPSCTLAGSA